MRRDNTWLAPLTGLAFLVLVVIAFLTGSESPDASQDSAGEVVEFYVDNKGSFMFLAALEAVAATLFVFFAGSLRRVLRDAEGPGGILSAVAFAGAIIFATGIAIDATITFTLAETADDIDPVAVQTLNALYNNDFFPFAVGMQLFLLATGISVLRHRALPRSIGWIAIVLGVVATTPVGFASFIGGTILVAVISVMLAMRARAAAPRVEPGPVA